MAHYDDAILPLTVKYGAASMPRTSSQITHTATGYRKVNQRWSQKLRRLKLQYQLDDDAFDAVLKFWEALEGPTHSGLARDWTDWNSTAGLMRDGDESQITMLDQPMKNTVTGLLVGDGSTTTFQLVKRYLSGSASHIRTIQKPQSGTLIVALDGVLQHTTGSPIDYSVDYSTGIVTFTGPPAAGLAPTAGFAFYVPVAFTNDEAFEVAAAEGGILEGSPDLNEVRL